ncbi:MAG TPA: hypothetical protein VF624_16865 [Tepidisphaeraceae bacterium]
MPRSSMTARRSASGVLGEADGGLVLLHFARELGEVGGSRLGLVGELAAGRVVDVDDGAAELAEQGGGGDAAGAVDAVENDFVPTAADAVDVEVV